MAILDPLKSNQWLANVGHFLGGYTIILTLMYMFGSVPVSLIPPDSDYRFLLWLRCNSWHLDVWVSLGLLPIIAFKEYFLDLRYESNETWKTSTYDLIGWYLGIAAAWSIHALRMGWP